MGTGCHSTALIVTWCLDISVPTFCGYKKGAVTKHPRKVLVEEAKNPVLHCREERDFLRLPFPGDFMLLVGLFPGLSCPTFGHFPYIMSNGVQAPVFVNLKL